MEDHCLNGAVNLHGEKRPQNPARERERDDLFKIQQERDNELFKIQQERERERERERGGPLCCVDFCRDFEGNPKMKRKKEAEADETAKHTGTTSTRLNSSKNTSSSSKVDLKWVQPGVNVLIDSGDDDKPFVAKVQHVDTAAQQAKVRTMKNGRRSVVSEKPATEHCVLTCRLLALLSC